MKNMRPVMAVSAVALMSMAAPLAANAQDMASGPYVGIQGGYTWTQDVEAENGLFRNEFEYKDGFTGILEGGYRLGAGLRAGLEVGWTRNVVGDIAGGPVGRAGGAGRTNAYTFMGVVGYELNPIGPLRPWVSAGAGVARLSFKGVGDAFAPGGRLDDKDNAVAWQVGAGVAYAVTPNLDLTVGYRFLDTGIVRMNDSAGNRVSFDYQNHSALVGVRYTFGAPPAPPARPEPTPAPVVAPEPPPAPPPAPAISRNFTVFFDWNQATLTADAQQVLRNVARDAQAGRITAVQVTGYTDTSGSPAYNQKLSERRAQAVRDFLTSEGLTADQITTAGRGETELLVPTADGVREPSNRRSVIIFPEGTPAS